MIESLYIDSIARLQSDMLSDFSSVAQRQLFLKENKNTPSLRDTLNGVSRITKFALTGK